MPNTLVASMRRFLSCPSSRWTFTDDRLLVCSLSNCPFPSASQRYW
jgi:hypothetical protein